MVSCRLFLKRRVEIKLLQRRFTLFRLIRLIRVDQFDFRHSGQHERQSSHNDEGLNGPRRLARFPADVRPERPLDHVGSPAVTEPVGPLAQCRGVTGVMA